ncbi:MAG: type II toxin-antitoxin system RelE/ParE family toxin, partial [Prevotellaceae bacterium]|nr:type II toxin-antitoxin system RelE/ParE family toxin [Prevotellaceae bacterium]
DAGNSLATVSTERCNPTDCLIAPPFTSKSYFDRLYGQTLITKHLLALEHNPRPFGCVKLSGFENTYRIRVGIYRIIYTIEDNILTVEIVKIDHRNKVYKSKD